MIAPRVCATPRCAEHRLQRPRVARHQRSADPSKRPARGDELVRRASSVDDLGEARPKLRRSSEPCGRQASERVHGLRAPEFAGPVEQLDPLQVASPPPGFEWLQLALRRLEDRARQLTSVTEGIGYAEAGEEILVVACIPDQRPTWPGSGAEEIPRSQHPPDGAHGPIVSKVLPKSRVRANALDVGLGVT